MNLDLKEKDGGIIFSVWVQPGSSRNEVSGIKESSLVVKLMAPPYENKANSALRQYLADILKIKLRDVELIKGEKSRNKTVFIKNLRKIYLENILKKMFSTKKD